MTLTVFERIDRRCLTELGVHAIEAGRVDPYAYERIERDEIEAAVA